MNRYLLIPDGEFEIQAALAVREMLKRHESRAKIYFFNPDKLGYFRDRGYPELKILHPIPQVLKRFPFLARLCIFRQVLRKRSGFREHIVVFQERPTLLPWIFLFSGKKPILINTIRTLDWRYTTMESLFLRWFSKTVLVNDRTLCLALRRRNVPAYFIGNLPADILKPLDLVFLTGKKTAYTLVPRQTSFLNDLIRLLELARQIDKKENSYYLLALPEGIREATFIQEASKKGWIFQKSLEGDIIMGYLRQGQVYTNLTHFIGEAIIQAERVVSTDALRILQAVGWGKRVVFLTQEDTAEIESQLENLSYFLEMNRTLQNRYGKRGAIHRIAAYLLRGVVEDDQMHFVQKSQDQ
ncbi:MAG TPA: hypothetical protein VLH40_10700 [Atribacteraceae bacterium]|nr:hypothetical protein [Atribacteraceae bacterium]